ncbi:subtilisin-like protein [Lactarius pseudohatsudake]|nr:subtilisin-like protein [Lactarius pseudohatsudake]
MRYHRLFVLSVLTAAPLARLATLLPSPWNDIHVKHTWNSVPINWESLGNPPAGTTIDFHVALKPHRESALIDALYEVSSPRHPKYGAHLSKEQVAKLVAPHPETLDLVSSWLEHYSVPTSSVSTSHGGGWITVAGVPVSQANELLGASYQLYRRTGTNDTAILRTVGYALPKVLHAHVKTVVPTTNFASLHTPRRKPHGRFIRAATSSLANATSLSRRADNDDGDEVTPEFVRELYRTIDYEPAAIYRNALGIAGFLDQYASEDDLTAFMEVARPDVEDATFDIVQINGGGNDQNHPGFEANVNVQYALAIAYPTPHTFYSTGGSMSYDNNHEPSPGDMFLTWINYLIARENIPQTISVPFGADEIDVPLEYATAVCDLFAQLGTRGVSVLFASGDDGVGNAKNCEVNGKVQFIPMYPASCPYVTSVGGTTEAEEIGASLSGGGFLFHFPRPKYQEEDVPVYLEHLGDQYDGLYNPAGRGIPDISAQSVNCVTIVEGEAILGDGTSCAVPIAAGVISLLNDYQISRGKNPLGFLNPWLYGDGLGGLSDITSGSNPGCNTDGFEAIDGWDPVTGLGTPDFVELQLLLHETTMVPRSLSETSNSTLQTDLGRQGKYVATITRSVQNTPKRNAKARRIRPTFQTAGHRVK